MGTLVLPPIRAALMYIVNSNLSRLKAKPLQIDKCRILNSLSSIDFHSEILYSITIQQNTLNTTKFSLIIHQSLLSNFPSSP